MSVSLSSIFNGYQSFLANGLPNFGGYIYTYQAGTTTLATTYTSSTGNIANPNPIPLTAGGTPPSEIWLTDGVAYKLVVVDRNSVPIPNGSFDNIVGAGSGIVSLGVQLLSDAGATFVAFLRTAYGAVKSTLAQWLNWQPPSVLDFMSDAQRADVLAGTLLLDVSAAVQTAVNYCLTNNKDLTVEGLCRIDTPVNIDRAVNTTTNEFHIRGRNSTSGFYTAQPISIFSSSLPGFTPGGASSECIVFQGVRFEASINTVNAFAVDGNAFLRIRFDSCYFRKMRLAYTSNFYQSWYVSNCNIRRMHGIFMEAGVDGPSYVGLDGFGFDLHFTDNVFEEGDMAGQSAFLKLAGQYNGGDMKGNLFEGATGPFLECIGGGCIAVSGNYFEALTQSVFKLGPMYTISFDGNRFGTGSDPAYYPIDCQTAYTVIGTGNFSEGNLYKSSSMQSTRALNDAGFYKTAAKGLLSFGDVAYNGNITDDVNHANHFKRIQSDNLLAGKADFSIGATRQNTLAMLSDGVSGVTPTGQFNWYTTSGFRDTMKLDLVLQDVPNGEYGYSLLTLQNNLFKVTGFIESTVAYKLPKYTTAGRPTYAQGLAIFDTTLGKMVIGGNAGWEVVTST